MRPEGSVFHYPYLWVDLAERGVEHRLARATIMVVIY
jgi:hypothetical protein